MGVVGDHRVGGFQNASGGAVVLLQFHYLERRPVVLQPGQILRARAAPGVDRLIVVADHGEVTLGQSQHAHQLVLGAVGVLILVHQQILNAMAPLLENPGLGAEHVRRHQDQIIEIHRVAGAQHAVVTAVGHRRAQFVVAAGMADGLIGENQFVFPVRDALLHSVHGGGVFLRLALQQDFLENFLAVRLVENREAAPQPARRQFAFEDAQPQVVEGGHNQPAGLATAGQRLHPLFHFPGGFIGEGHRGDAPRRHAPFLDQPGDLAGDHAGLAGAGARQDQQGAIRVQYGFLLARVEIGHQGSRAAAVAKRVSYQPDPHGEEHGTR